LRDVIPLDQMPEDNDDLAKISVEFPHLDPNTPSNCPVSMDDIQRYLKLEDADGESVETRELHFIRTALVERAEYWIWDYRESDGAHCYVTVSRSPEGRACLGMDGNWHGLTPEQFILGDYHQVF
jgi:hypothetical protein